MFIPSLRMRHSRRILRADPFNDDGQEQSLSYDRDHHHHGGNEDNIIGKG